MQDEGLTSRVLRRCDGVFMIGTSLFAFMKLSVILSTFYAVCNMFPPRSSLYWKTNSRTMCRNMFKDSCYCPDFVLIGEVIEKLLVAQVVKLFAYYETETFIRRLTRFRCYTPVMEQLNQVHVISKFN